VLDQSFSDRKASYHINALQDQKLTDSDC
jgi:hypothetical protein